MKRDPPHNTNPKPTPSLGTAWGFLHEPDMRNGPELLGMRASAYGLRSLWRSEHWGSTYRNRDPDSGPQFPAMSVVRRSHLARP